MSTIDRLAALPTLAEIPREQLQWLVDHGELRHAEDGEIFRLLSEELIGLYVPISGRFSIRMEQGGVEREVMEVPPGHLTGFLPYSRMAIPRAHVVAVGPVEFLFVHARMFRSMVRECYDFTAACVHEMLDRARLFKAEDKRQERLAALGRLSAGLAHELNNPASAAVRAARELEGAQADVIAASRALGAADLEGEPLRALEALEATTRRAGTAATSPVGVADVEERVGGWLEARELDPALAYPLAEGGLTVADLDAAASALGAARLAVVLRYLAATRTARDLAVDLSSAAGRIHALVAAVKRHTHMDRGSALDPIQLEQHLTDTVTLMRSKASLKGAALELSIEADLPAVEASVSDLNQAWMHLIDNAIDAAPESGRITIDARREHGSVVVRVIDDGPGIPPEDQERIFEPFFTTKDVGEGRGLGLDVVRTVVHAHRGALELSSVPGRTEFRVTLPAASAR